MTYDEISKRLAGGGSDGEDNDGIFSDEGDEEWDSENEVDEQKRMLFDFLSKKHHEEEGF